MKPKRIVINGVPCPLRPIARDSYAGTHHIEFTFIDHNEDRHVALIPLMMWDQLTDWDEEKDPERREYALKTCKIMFITPGMPEIKPAHESPRRIMI